MIDAMESFEWVRVGRRGRAALRIGGLVLLGSLSAQRAGAGEHPEAGRSAVEAAFDLDVILHSGIRDAEGIRTSQAGDAYLMYGGDRVVVFDAATGVAVREIWPTVPTREAAFGRDAREVLVLGPVPTMLRFGAGDAAGRVLDVPTDRHPIALSPSGGWVLMAADDALEVWSAESGEPVRVWAGVKRPFSYTRPAAISRDGQRAAFATGGSGLVLLGADGPTTLLGPEVAVQAVAFDAEGASLFALDRPGEVRRWATGAPSAAVSLGRPGRDGVRSTTGLFPSPDGRSVLVFGPFQQEGVLLGAGGEAKSLPLLPSARTVGWLSPSRLLVASEGARPLVRAVEGGASSKAEDRPPNLLDGRGFGELVFWEDGRGFIARDRSEVGQATPILIEWAHPGGALRADFAYGYDDGSPLERPRTGEEAYSPRPRAPPTMEGARMLWSDDRRGVLLDEEGVVHGVDARGRLQRVTTFEVDAFAAVFAGSQRVAGVTGEDLVVWDWRTGRRALRLPLSTFEPEDKGPIVLPNGDHPRTGAWSPKGCAFAVGTVRGVVRIVDCRPRSPVLRGDLRLEGAEGMAFDPEGSRLAVGSSGSEVVLLDAATGDILWRRALMRGPVRPLAFHPTRPILAVGAGPGRLLFLRTIDGALVLEMQLGHAWKAARDDVVVTLAASTPEGALEASPEALPEVSIAKDGRPLGVDAVARRRTPGLVAHVLSGDPLQATPAAPRAVLEVAGADGARALVRWVVTGDATSVRRLAVSVDGQVIYEEIPTDEGRWTAAGIQGMTFASFPPGEHEVEILCEDGLGRTVARATTKVAGGERRAEAFFEVVPQVAHAEAPAVAALDAGGRWAASAEDGSLVTLWSLTSGLVVRRLSGCPASAVERLAFTPDAQAVALRGQSPDGPTVFCSWSVPQGELRRVRLGRPGPDEAWVGEPARWAHRQSVGDATVELQGGRLRSRDADGQERSIPVDGTALAVGEGGHRILVVGASSLLLVDDQLDVLSKVRSSPSSLRQITWTGTRRLLFREAMRVLRFDFDRAELEVLSEAPDETGFTSITGLDEAYAWGLRGQVIVQKDEAPGAGWPLPGKGSSSAFPLQMRLSPGGDRVLALVSTDSDRRRDLAILDGRRGRVLPIPGWAQDGGFAGRDGLIPFAVGDRDRPDDLGRFGNPALYRLDTLRPIPVERIPIGPSTPSGGGRIWIWAPGATRLRAVDVPLPTLFAADGHPRDPYVVAGGPFGGLVLVDLSSESVIHRWPALAGAVDVVRFSPGGERVAVGTRAGTVHILDFPAQKEGARSSPFGQVLPDVGAVASLSWSPDGSQLAVLSDDGLLRVFESSGWTERFSLLMSGAGRLVMLPSGGYLADPDVLPTVAVRSGGRVYAFEQLDAELNRPHEVLAALGSPDTERIAALRRAHERRYRPADRSGPRPTIDVRGHRNEGGEVVVELDLTPSRAPLHRVWVLANDVPLAPMTLPERTGAFAHTVRIPLTAGANRLRLQVEDRERRRSLAALVTAEGPTGRPRALRALIVGVSKYRESVSNLDYADDDARAMAELLRTVPIEVDRVETTVLVDEEATREAIDRAAAGLAGGSVDDFVLIYLAGHGVLEKGRYHFAPHDMAFAEPETTGLSLEAIERYFEGAAGRRRVLLLDSCHAGPLRSTRATGATPALDANVRTRSVARLASARITAMEEVDDLFADLARGSGAVILAAATGEQYAYETSGHGLFTSTLLRGLREGEADGDFDGAVRLLELRDYVRDQVARRSGGAQLPTLGRAVFETDHVLARVPGLAGPIPGPRPRGLSDDGRLMMESDGTLRRVEDLEVVRPGRPDSGAFELGAFDGRWTLLVGFEGGRAESERTLRSVGPKGEAIGAPRPFEGYPPSLPGAVAPAGDHVLLVETGRTKGAPIGLSIVSVPALEVVATTTLRTPGSIDAALIASDRAVAADGHSAWTWRFERPAAPERRPLLARGLEIWSMTIAARSPRVAVLGGRKGRPLPDVQVFDLEDSKRSTRILHGLDDPLTVALDPGGEHLAVSSVGGIVRLWRLEDQRLVFEGRVGHRGAEALHVAAGGHHLVTAGFGGMRALRVTPADPSLGPKGVQEDPLGGPPR